jgi:NAD(P)-dependent dehydrogenase (short-subunit alcohol dehydrogenase family)
MTWNLESALVPVTGAASGIGLAICKHLRAEGARPLLLDIDQARLQTALAEVYGAQDDASRYGYVLDVRDPKAVEQCFADIRERHGLVTHAVANAGAGAPAHVLDITDAQWQNAIDINLSGVMYVCRAAARHLSESRSGSIVNIASIAGLMAKKSRIAYVSSKAAVVNLTRGLALDLGEYGVRVNAVAPGVIETPLQLMNARDKIEQLVARSALQRLGTTDEVAHAVLFLLSDFSSYVTGHTLVADGGLTINYA